MWVKISGVIGTTKEGGFVALKPMVERFGVEVTGKCRICGAEGRTEMHHIISASRIAEMDKAGVARLYRGVVSAGPPDTDGERFDDHFLDDDDYADIILAGIAMSRSLKPDIIKRLPANIIELCVPCHRDTDSHRYRQWREELQAGRDPDARAKRIKKAVRMKFQGRFRCSGTTKRGTSCRYRVKVEGGYCQYHGE